MNNCEEVEKEMEKLFPPIGKLALNMVFSMLIPVFTVLIIFDNIATIILSLIFIFTTYMFAALLGVVLEKKYGTVSRMISNRYMSKILYK